MSPKLEKNDSICYDKMVTLQDLLERLYPNKKSRSVRDSFSETVFAGVLGEYSIRAITRNTNKSAFYIGNIRRNKENTKRYFAIADPTKKLKAILCSATTYKKAYTQLLSNCSTIIFDAQQNGTEVTAAFFDFLNPDNTYTPEIFALIRRCLDNGRQESVLLLTVIIAIFQDYSTEIFSCAPKLDVLLAAAVREVSEEVSVIYRAAADTLERAASEQGRMLAFRDAKHKIDMPHIGAAIPDILGKSKMSLSRHSNEHTKPLSSYYEKAPYSNMMVTGCGGSGKTFSLIYLGEKLLQDKGDVIPFYIPLNALNTKSSREETPILRYFLDTVTPISGLEEQELRDFLRINTEVTILFLLDGYNEMNQPLVKTNLIAEIGSISRNYKAVRFMLTGRYDISESFATGGKLPFCTKQILPLSNEAIQGFLAKQVGDSADLHWESISRSGFLETLRNPMALAMYAHVCMHNERNDTPEEMNLYLPYTTPETLGELIGNFIEQIKSIPSLRGNTVIQDKVRVTMQILCYIAYKMVQRGNYRITELELAIYFSEAADYYNRQNGMYIPEDFYAAFLSVERQMGFLVYSHFNGGEYRFYHQNFRDYFYAKFLLQILCHAVHLAEKDCDAACTQIEDVFSVQEISDEILELFGEASMERTYLPKYGREPSERSIIEQGLMVLQYRGDDAKAQRCVDVLIRAARLARKNDMSTFHFDGLNLEKCSLSGVSLYSVYNGRIYTASFKGTKLSESIFMPNGHMAAVHTFTRIKDWVLSISADAIWSFNLKTRMHQYITACSGTFVSHCAYSERHQLLFVGDKNGWVRVYRHTEDASGGLCLKECPELIFALSDVIRQITIDETHDLCIIGAKGEHLCYFPIANPTQKKVIRLSKTILRTPKYRFLLIGPYLYLASGLSVYRVSRDATEITDDDLFMEIAYDAPGAYIFEFNYLHTTMDGYFLFNIRGLNRSAIIAAAGSDRILIRERAHTADWTGFNALTLLTNRSDFCICNNITNAKHPAITVVSHKAFQKEFICQDYYGVQNMEIADCYPLNEDEIMLSSIDRSLQIINTRTEHVMARFPGYNPGIHHMHVCNDDTILICTYDGAFARLQKNRIDEKWNCTQCKAAHTNWCNEIFGFYLDGTFYAAICGNDCCITLWNVETEEHILTIPTVGPIVSVCHVFDGYIVAPSRAGMVTIYKVDPQERTYKLVGHFYPGGKSTSSKNLLNFYANLITSDESSASVLLLSLSADKTSCIYRMDIQKDELLKVTTDRLFMRKHTRVRTMASAYSEEKDCFLYMIAGACFCPEEVDYIAVLSDEGCTLEYQGEYDMNSKKLRCDTMTENAGYLSGAYFEYNGKLYIAAASYFHNLHIFLQDEEQLTEAFVVPLGFPAIDVQFRNDALYFSSLSGRLCCIKLSEIFSENEHLTLRTPDAIASHTIYQNLSGLYINHVDLTESEHTFSDGFKEIIRRYEAQI